MCNVDSITAYLCNCLLNVLQYSLLSVKPLIRNSDQNRAALVMLYVFDLLYKKGNNNNVFKNQADLFILYDSGTNMNHKSHWLQYIYHFFEGTSDMWNHTVVINHIIQATNAPQ